MPNRKLSFLAIGLFFSLGFLVGYFVKKPKIITQIPETPSKIQEIPECNFGRCPEYVSLDTDNDGQSESVAIIPTAMTKGAGRAIVIDDGKIVFKTGEYAGIGVKTTSKPGELIIEYSKDFNRTGPDLMDQLKFIYKDGQYILSN